MLFPPVEIGEVACPTGKRGGCESVAWPLFTPLRDVGGSVDEPCMFRTIDTFRVCDGPRIDYRFGAGATRLASSTELLTSQCAV